MKMFGMRIFFMALMALIALICLQATASLAAPEPVPPGTRVDAEWTCKTFAMDERGQAAGELNQTITVGTQFLLVCEGSSIVLAQTNLGLELNMTQKYALRLLQTRSLTDVRAEFVATTWVAGQIKLNKLILSDGVSRVNLGNLELNVATVIDQKSNPEGKPYPPWAPMLLAWPLWVWGAIGTVILLLILIVVVVTYRRVQHKRFLNLLESHPIALTPYHQFNRDLRRLGRELPSMGDSWPDEKVRDFLRELDLALRWFLARELIVPTIDRSPREVMHNIKRADERLAKLIRRDLSVVLSELQKARNFKHSAVSNAPLMSVSDSQQLIDLARLVADRVDGAKASTKERQA
jgi:hypothetical protein